MKAIISIILVSLTFGISGNAQESSLNIHGMARENISTSGQSKKTPHFLAKSMNWSYIRPLSEINDSTEADAFPYLSPDGLRLYYTKSMGSSNLYMSSRPNIQSDFGPFSLVSQTIPNGSFSCWLTNDELDIYYTKNSELYHCSRTSMANFFSMPEPINLTGHTSTFLAAPSFSPDMEELYLYSAYSGTRGSIYRFTRVDDLNYVYADSLFPPAGHYFSPGQISKDGYKFCVSAGDGNGYEQLYLMTRSSLTSPFTNPQLLHQNVNTNNVFYHTQPSLSQNEDVIVWVNNNTGLWYGNDLYIGTGKQVGLYEEKISKTIQIFPNPSSGIVNLELSDSQNYHLEVCSILGQKLLERDLSSSINKLDLSHLPNGMYIINIIQNGTFNQCNWVKQ